MPKSRRFQPGDSAPDFSHLADHDPESDEPQRQPGDADPDPPAEATDDRTTDAESQPPPRDANPADDQPPVSDSHVFFEGEQPLSEDALAGETTAYSPPHQQPDAAASDDRPVPQLDAAANESVFSDATEIGDPSRDMSADHAAQLTDVGIPAFQVPPGVDETGASDADNTPPASDSMERAAGNADASSPAEPAPLRTGRAPDGSSSVAPEPPPEIPAADQTVAAATAAAPTTHRPRSSTRTQRSGMSTAATADDRQRLLLILLVSYASAITIAFVWLWLARNNARPHELENLPDVAPLGPNEFRYAPQNASMPGGHTLPLGDAQQLGYIKVEPLRVTRGPVQFAHYSDATQSRSATEPTLKLWLRFTNVSTDQLIAPLDANLLLTRSYQVETDTVLANQLLLPADKTSQKPAFVIDHPITSEWDLASQKLGYRLAPGESLETYIPLEPGSASHLEGDLLWRVHFRKGYHDPTGHGVTTMIEVPFSTADIQVESTTPT